MENDKIKVTISIEVFAPDLIEVHGREGAKAAVLDAMRMHVHEFIECLSDNITEVNEVPVRVESGAIG